MKPTIPVKPGPAKSSASVVTSRPPTAEERRRAQRVLLRMPVHVHIEGKPEPVRGITHTVSENGGLIVLPDPLTVGTKVTVENQKTQKRVEARVARPPQISGEGSLIPIEFLTPTPGFWGIIFPPSAN
ncbi:MAG TPA: PilZ domain-containing protein [Candidatus Acidoferrum sp.]|nr:PilZ domain-containing protein [Candidatus Acidoferrum sp.]